MPTIEQTVTRQISELVALPSVSSTDPSWDSSNRRVIERLAEFAEGQGFATEILPLPGGDKANLIARLGPEKPLPESGDQAHEQPRGGLVLSGHTDTVPFDEGRWTSDPLSLTERDGKLFGLGSADMKGFFAIALAAASRIDPSALRAPLYILATADEESSMNGARALESTALAGAEAVIIGEPTSLRPVRLHKGIMMQAIQLRGQSGHSSNPALGNNAIEGVPRLLQLLDELRTELAARYHCALLQIPAPTLNFGCLHGGDSPNRICGAVELHFDVRMVPGLDFSVVEASLQRCIELLAAERGLDVSMRRLVQPIDAFEESADAKLVKVVEAVTGVPAEAVNYATEAPFLQRLGLETIVLGPGSIDCAHQPDEHLALDQLTPALTILEQTIGHYCCRPQ